MKVIILLCIFVIIFLNISLMDAHEIGFLEEFSLATDREKALKQLIPGTSEYYYYHCLHTQHMKQFDKTDELLKQWIKREGYTSQVTEILNRQALFRYHETPGKSLNYIKKEMNLFFDHQKEMDQQKKQYSSRLNQQTISMDALKKKALSRYRDLTGFEDDGLDILTPDQLNPDQRRDFLKRLKRPDVQGLSKMVINDLEYAHSSGFGSHHIHQLMFKSQLDNCLKRAPDLLNQSNFVYAYIKKLAPADHIDIRYHLDEKKAYLSRLWNFVEKLNPSHNSLKAHVLYNILDFNRRQGNYDQTLFLEYLTLPRNVFYMNQSYISQHHYPVDLTADYQHYSLLPPIISDEELVVDYLSYFLVNEHSHYGRFHQYLDDEWLKNVFVETKIVHMLGDMEEWFSMISQHRFQSLKDRVDIDFSVSNPQFFSSDDLVTLNVYIKNVKTLIVKIFEINTFNYFSTYHKKPDTGINLDGLSPSYEKIFTYDIPPFLRKLETFSFPEMNHSGVFVVELIGNGKSSRALIRKGKLFFVESIGPAGHEFRIYDDMNQIRPDAVIKFDGYEYKPDNNGLIIIPFTTHPEYQPIIIQDKNFCSLSGFDHLSEKYDLNVGFYVDRESLLTRKTSKVLIRPGLSINNHPISLSLLTDISLHIESIDMEGVSSSKVVPDIQLFEDQDAVYEFQVPENLCNIRFSLKANIQPISQQKSIELMDDADFELNGMNKTNQFENILLNHEDNSYTLEVLGKNGEPRIHRSVNVELKHKFFCNRIIQQLQTDKNGCIHLGALTYIDHIKVSCTDQHAYQWNLFESKAAYPEKINSHVNDIIQIPYVAFNDKRQCALFEKRRSTWLSDYSHAIAYKKGCIQIKGLEPGNYDLFIKPDDVHIKIYVDNGIQQQDVIFSDHRALSLQNIKSPFFSHVDTKDNDVVIKIGNVTEFTRLHVIATRFVPAYSIFHHMLPPECISEEQIPLTKQISHYISGRKIGDEYRYIIDRKYADKYPGNMLAKPGLLLNPWSIRKTETEKQQIRPDEKYDTKKFSSKAMYSKPDSSESETDYSQKIVDQYSNINFLDHTSIMLFNLKPDKKGVITIQKDQLTSFRHLHLLAVDPLNTVYQEISLPKAKIVKKDLRLTKPFDSTKHFTEQKRISILQANESLIISDITTSKFEIYDSIEKVFNLLRTISHDPVITEFEFILQWPELSEKDKQKYYSEKACHELNFFLYHKDREFFYRVIDPYIKNKKDKTFMDQWLSGDVSSYDSLLAFSQLNIVEKILFARRQAANTFQIKRYVKDLFDMVSPDIETYNYFYDIALKGKALDILYPFECLSEIPEDRAEEPDETSLILHAPAASIEKEEMAFAPPKRAIRSRKYFKDRAEARSKTRPFFKKLDKTNEWAENNYFKRSIKEQQSDLIKVNAFWKDFSEHDSQPLFLSKNIIVANTHFSEIMLALSVLDLPFHSKEHKVIQKGAELSLQASSPMIVFHKEIMEGQLSENIPSIMINQNFYRIDERYVYINNEQIDKFVEHEFLSGITYGSQVVLSNPTSSHQKLVMMYQIPEGAIPVHKGKYTESIPITLKPFSTKSFDYFFYFPETGTYAAYPIQVAKDEKFIASTEPKDFKVVQKLSAIDHQSWKYISQHGNDSDVIDYLDHNNLNRIDLYKIAFRMKNKSFFEEVIALLKNRQFFHSVLWSYGIYHGNKAIITEYLEQSKFVENCGLYIKSPLLTINPMSRNMFEYLEYAPLVNERVHPLGKKPTIMNDRFFQQYHHFLELLSYHPELDANDMLAVTGYLLTQDRVSLAIQFFYRIHPKDIQTKIQYDYIHAYILMYQGKTTDVEKVIKPYLNYPVLRWQKLFLAVSSQLDEIKGHAPTVIDKDDRNQLQTQLASTEQSFDFSIKSGQIHISYQNISNCQINYYPMDIELLFSRNPFVQKQINEFMIIKPAETSTIDLPQQKSVQIIELPEIYQNKNLIVEMTAQGKQQSHVCYANSLQLQIMENYGQLRLTHSETHAPLPKAYVKVYAQMTNKDIQFHKDGYTDLRGRFDYVSLNTEELDLIEKFALLVIDETYGSVTREVKVPKK